jgi:tetratricopeptide (TPR) repeat protein
MAQSASNPKIEELRLRIKADPKSRLFFPLAEELRKVQQLAEAEQVLRQGLTIHPTYLSAWVSLGRICREQGKNEAAVESLSKALLLDPGNVVAARLLADAYLALGEKVEAIKKYKLVHALLPSDQDLEALIARLDQEINGALATAQPVEPEPVAPAPAASAPPVAPEPAAETPFAAAPEPDEDLRPMPTMETPFGDAFATATEPEPFPQSDDDRVFADAATAMAEEHRIEIATGDDEPMSVAHSDSPFEEPAGEVGYGSDAFAIEQPSGMHIDRAPLEAEVPEPLGAEGSDPFGDDTQLQAEDFYAPAAESARTMEREEPYIETGIAADLPFALESTLEPPPADDFAKTITMADLYAAQGLVDEARDIYEDILARDPNNEAIRAKLEGLSSIVSEPALPEEPDDAAYDDERAPEEQAPLDAFASLHLVSDAAPPDAAAPDVTADGVAPHDAAAEDVAPFASAEPAAEVRSAGAGSGSANVPNASAVAAGPNREKIARLEQWLAKVGRREVGHVQ